MIKVFLREKQLKHGKRGLYLDFYPPVQHPETSKSTRREHLRLYVFTRAKTETERDHNKQTKMLAENIRAQRQLELQSGVYGFFSMQSKKKDFLAFFAKLVETKKKNSAGNCRCWRVINKHLIDFTGGKCRAADVTEKFCNDFKDYLLNKESLTQNTASWYYGKFKSAVGKAVEDKLLSSNPMQKIKPIELLDTQREFLTLEELQKLASMPFDYDDLRRAALFSALTGLRFSDINKLTWREIQKSKSQGYYLRFRQKKTGQSETLPISEEAVDLLGTRGADADKVFTNLYYWQIKHFSKWITSAGITKNITFHCFRHTYATLQLTLGTDVYTVSKMLGHKNLKTTQIYAKIIDAKKREAANRISLK